MKYARLNQYNSVIELYTPPDGFSISDCFVPDIVAQFVACPQDAEIGWLYIDSNWEAPTAPPGPAEQSSDAVAVESIQVSPIEFKLLFTAPERVAIKTIATTDPLVEDFLAIIDDSRLTVVDLSLKSTIDALTYLESLQLITSTRKAEILQNTKI